LAFRDKARLDSIPPQEKRLQSNYARWRRGFNENAKDIEAACKSLQTVVEYSVNPALATPRYVEELSGHQWFRERVYDIYLWHGG
jgi:hypothetical protein